MKRSQTATPEYESFPERRRKRRTGVTMVEMVDNLLYLYLYTQRLHDSVELVSREVDDMIEKSPQGPFGMSCLNEIREHLDALDDHAREMSRHLDREHLRICRL